VTETVAIAGKKIGITFSVQVVFVLLLFYILYVVENWGRFFMLIATGFCATIQIMYILADKKLFFKPRN